VPELLPIDRAAVVAFWERGQAAGSIPRDQPPTEVVERFGDSAELADELLDLVLHGPKRATAGSEAAMRQTGAVMPVVGDLWVAADAAGRPRALLRTTEVRVGPLSSVDDAFAWDEGEGDRSRAMWLADHEAFFRRQLPTLGLELDPDMPTVFERFEVVYTE
jgi:uncharacterized protein YhfF